MHALILAGGLGTRLSPIVSDRPKPLAPIGRRPFLDYQLEFLQAHGISDVVLCVGYRHQQIQEYLQTGKDWAIDIQCSVESEPLGTAGAIKHAAGFVDDTFLVMNGDTYADFDLGRLIYFHYAGKVDNPSTLGTLALTRVQDARSYGAVRLDDKSRIVAFEEKGEQTTDACFVSAGVYVFEPDILELIAAGKRMSLEYDVFPPAIAKDRLLLGCVIDGFFVDIGTPAGYSSFQNHMRHTPC